MDEVMSFKVSCVRFNIRDAIMGLTLVSVNDLKEVIRVEVRKVISEEFKGKHIKCCMVDKDNRSEIERFVD